MATSSSTRRMIGGLEETSASFEARSAPRSYPTGSVLLHCMSPKVAHHDDLCTAALHPLIGGKPTKPSPDRVEKIRDGESPAMSTSPTACGATEATAFLRAYRDGV